MKEYEHIYEDIKNKIFARELKPGDKLPSIKEMTKIYQVSSITVRNSLALLANENYIYTKERSGCFVKEREIDLFKMQFNELTNINEEIIETKVHGVTRIHDFYLANFTQDENQKTAQVTKIRRTFHTFLGAPVSYDIKYLLHHSKGTKSQINATDDLKQIDQYLESEIRKTLKIEVITPSQDIQEILRIKENTPVFYFKQQYYDKFDSLIAVGQTFIIADSVHLFAESS
ncbi:GntR family transcriptional regulator [Eubacterium sp.]|uniref:GntR family transcriptional regulator n=1 Tax=Eubacterium sp. TaxID=142586 RepID=UPI002FCC2BF9